MQFAEWNKRLESFNRDNLYGTDIISIANLMQDYNTKMIISIKKWKCLL